MTTQGSYAYIFNTHAEAETAIRALSKSSFDVKKLSIVGKGYHSEEHPMGFYTVGDRMKTWGSMGAFWGSIWGILAAPAVFFLPGLGVIALAGPIVTLLVSALEGAAVIGGLSAISAAFMSIGASKDDVIRYDTALKADKYVLIVHGTPDDIGHARSVLDS